jgi:hypothetical protein
MTRGPRMFANRQQPDEKSRSPHTRRRVRDGGHELGEVADAATAIAMLPIQLPNQYT